MNPTPPSFAEKILITIGYDSSFLKINDLGDVVYLVLFLLSSVLLGASLIITLRIFHLPRTSPVAKKYKQILLCLLLILILLTIFRFAQVSLAPKPKC
jgi:hypothetical protein